eukprot:CFRG1887T1
MPAANTADSELSQTRTVYISNLNEKVKVPALKQALIAIFSQFGEILDVSARTSLKCKGQAWVAFKSTESAVSAVEALQGFVFHEKPMKLQYAKTKSDSVAKYEGGFVPRPRRPKGEKWRLEKEAKDRALQATITSNNAQGGWGQPNQQAEGQQWNMTPGNNAYQRDSQQQQRTNYTGPPPTATQSAQVPTNPPNHILLLTGLPEGTTQDLIFNLFNRFYGLKEVRMIPGRHDIAFVEYVEESQASIAKAQLEGTDILPGHPLKVMFAKKQA